jgi:flagellum-specific ATP synthase
MPMVAATHSFTLYRLWGTVTEVAPGMVKIAGISELAGVGNEIIIEKQDVTVLGRNPLSVSGDCVTALLFSPCDFIRIGDAVQIQQEPRVEPGDHWLGRSLTIAGKFPAPVRPLPTVRATNRRLNSAPLPAHARRGIGERLATGWMVTDTLLPICQGQRLGPVCGIGCRQVHFSGFAGCRP